MTLYPRSPRAKARKHWLYRVYRATARARVYACACGGCLGTSGYAGTARASMGLYPRVPGSRGKIDGRLYPGARGGASVTQYCNECGVEFEARRNSFRGQKWGSSGGRHS